MYTHTNSANDDIVHDEEFLDLAVNPYQELVYGTPLEDSRELLEFIHGRSTNNNRNSHQNNRKRNGKGGGGGGRNRNKNGRNGKKKHHGGSGGGKKHRGGGGKEGKGKDYFSSSSSNKDSMFADFSPEDYDEEYMRDEAASINVPKSVLVTIASNNRCR